MTEAREDETGREVGWKMRERSKYDSRQLRRDVTRKAVSSRYQTRQNGRRRGEEEGGHDGDARAKKRHVEAGVLDAKYMGLGGRGCDGSSKPRRPAAVNG